MGDHDSEARARAWAFIFKQSGLVDQGSTGSEGPVDSIQAAYCARILVEDLGCSLRRAQCSIRLLTTAMSHTDIILPTEYLSDVTRSLRDADSRLFGFPISPLLDVCFETGSYVDDSGGGSGIVLRAASEPLNSELNRLGLDKLCLALHDTLTRMEEDSPPEVPPPPPLMPKDGLEGTLERFAKCVDVMLSCDEVTTASESDLSHHSFGQSCEMEVVDVDRAHFGPDYAQEIQRWSLSKSEDDKVSNKSEVRRSFEQLKEGNTSFDEDTGSLNSYDTFPLHADSEPCLNDGDDLPVLPKSLPYPRVLSQTLSLGLQLGQRSDRARLIRELVQDEERFLMSLLQLMQLLTGLTSKSKSGQVVSSSDYKKIFQHYEEVGQFHKNLLSSLSVQLSMDKDDPKVGPVIPYLVSSFPRYKDLCINATVASDTIEKCKSNKNFNGFLTMKILPARVETFEQFLLRVPKRLDVYATMFKNILTETHCKHEDFEQLAILNTKFMLFKEGLDLIEKKKSLYQTLSYYNMCVGLENGSRKSRFLFLFFDYIVCANYKNHSYQLKWTHKATKLSLTRRTVSESEPTIPITPSEEIDKIRGELANYKAEARLCSKDKKKLQKIKKQINQKEALLSLLLPSHAMYLYHASGKVRTLLFSSQKEVDTLRAAIIPRMDSSVDITGDLFSTTDVQSALYACLEDEATSIGTKLKSNKQELLQEIVDTSRCGLNGFLHARIVIPKMPRSDIFCTFEVDNYGHFFQKAKTKLTRPSDCVIETFCTDMEQSCKARLLVHRNILLKNAEVCAVLDVNFQESCIEDGKRHYFTVEYEKATISLILLYSTQPSSGVLENDPLAVFGVELTKLAEIEGGEIVSVVRLCIKEVEKRGMAEMGIYRISGIASGIQSLKRAFDERSPSLVDLISESDVHAVAGCIKLFFRELPTGLFPEAGFQRLMQNLTVRADPESQVEAVKYVLDLMPNCHRQTFLFMLDHLRRVAELKEVNKMDNSNISTVWGPTLLRYSGEDSAERAAADASNVSAHINVFRMLLLSDHPALHYRPSS